LAACAGPKSVGTSWVMQPAGAGACTAAETANGSCFLIDDWQEMMVPPVVVGPGRILVVTRAGLRRDRARAPAADPFVIEEITRAGEQVRAHEFHRTTVEHEKKDHEAAWRLPGGTREGVAHGAVLASYLHLHWAGQPAFAGRFAAACAAFRAGPASRRAAPAGVARAGGAP